MKRQPLSKPLYLSHLVPAAWTQQRVGQRLTTVWRVALPVCALVGAFLTATETKAQNTFYGTGAGGGITTGTNDSGFGSSALLFDSSGSDNTAIGSQALYNTATGSGNTAGGYLSFYRNMGQGNTGVGMQTGYSTTTGSYNCALGYPALFGNTTGRYNIALGQRSGTAPLNGSYNIHIGHTGLAGDTATTRIGTKGVQTNAYMAGIYGAIATGGVGVIIDSNGHLGTTTSSARFKEDIQPMEDASEDVLSLRPVTFRYKKEFDPVGTDQFGLVAEEVAKVNPDLVLRDDGGKPYTVRYEAISAMLLNEFLKEHRQVEARHLENDTQKAAIAELQAGLAVEQKKVAALRDGIHRMSNDLALANPGAQKIANTFYGDNAGGAITTGTENSGFGYHALQSDTTGNNNTAAGSSALAANSTGTGNTAIGRTALTVNTSGIYNTAVGWNALAKNTTGQYNTALGPFALGKNTTGGFNIAVGYDAGYNLTTGDYNIDIGNFGVTGESNTIRIGNTGIHTSANMAGIYGVTVASGIPLLVDSTGHLGTTTSSARFKESIEPMENASEVIFSLRPVAFRYTKEVDRHGIAQFGLVADEVAKIAPNLVVRDDKGRPSTVRYDAINAMLLNEFLKSHRTLEAEASKNQAQDSIISRLRALYNDERDEIASVNDGIQRVSEDLLNRPMMRKVTNTFYGTGAGTSISTGTNDSGFGYDALHATNSGSSNTGIGFEALSTNNMGASNTGVGSYALTTNSVGIYNTAVGKNALNQNSTGDTNIAFGRGALYYSTSGDNNIAVGYRAGFNLTSGSTNIYIGNGLFTNESNTIRIGQIYRQTNAYMAGIYGVTVPTGIPVFVNSANHLGTAVSLGPETGSIAPMGKQSEAVLAMRPVRFHYKKDLDPAGIPQFGLVAEEVAKIAPDLVVFDADGKPYTIRYQAVNAMLLNEFLKDHRKIAQGAQENQVQEATLAELEARFVKQHDELAALRGGLQQVRRQMRQTKPAAARVL